MTLAGSTVLAMVLWLAAIFRRKNGQEMCFSHYGYICLPFERNGL
jgi:hypothetical protein